MKLEKGNWPAYNVRAIVRNVAGVFKAGDIGKLQGPAYKFITLHMGFIAHYDINGFKCEYQDLRDFAEKLQTGELGGDRDSNLREADRQERDADFRSWYGPAYNKSIAETIRGIVAAVRAVEAETALAFTNKERDGDLALAGALVNKWK